MVRLAKAIMSLALAGFCLLVAYDNVIDYDTNFAFVQHVLSMDTVGEVPPAIGRAITEPRIWQGTFALIIIAEALSGLLFLIGGVVLLVRLDSSAIRFRQGKAWVAAAATVGFLLWFVGFMVAGGEWFQMGRSPQWNGQITAFHAYATILGVLIFVMLPEPPTATD
jgi:predicted small integral membrane protein